MDNAIWCIRKFDYTQKFKKKIMNVFSIFLLICTLFKGVNLFLIDRKNQLFP